MAIHFPGARRLSVGVTGLALSLAGLALAQSGPGPGVPSLSFSEKELFKPLARIGRDFLKTGGASGTAAMHNGYLVIPNTSAGYLFLDISDPRKPRLVGAADNKARTMREGHAVGFSYSYPGMYAVTLAKKGIEFRDWTDVSNPKVIGSVDLPGMISDDYEGTWWLCWQAPYVFVAASSRGLYVVEARDPTQARLINHTPTSALGGRAIGSIFVVGNMLVMGKVEGNVTVDVSDPAKPTLMAIASRKNNKGEPRYFDTGYSSMLNGNRLIGASGIILDVADPAEIRSIDTIITRMPGDKDASGGYLTVQDGFMHLGNSTSYLKVDMAAGKVSARAEWFSAGETPVGKPDMDFVSVIGNLFTVGDDHGLGTQIYAHDTRPDRTPPEVNMVNPSPAAQRQALTSRVGLTFTDQIDLRSVTSSTFIVRPKGGQPLKGKYSHQTGIVNFCPDEKLKPNTVYEVVVPARGVKDFAGNSTAKEFVSSFSTGAYVPPTTPILAPTRRAAPALEGWLYEASGRRISGAGAGGPGTLPILRISGDGSGIRVGQAP